MSTVVNVNNIFYTGDIPGVLCCRIWNNNTQLIAWLKSQGIKTYRFSSSDIIGISLNEDWLTYFEIEISNHVSTALILEWSDYMRTINMYRPPSASFINYGSASFINYGHDYARIYNNDL